MNNAGSKINFIPACIHIHINKDFFLSTRVELRTLIFECDNKCLPDVIYQRISVLSVVVQKMLFSLLAKATFGL